MDSRLYKLGVHVMQKPVLKAVYFGFESIVATLLKVDYWYWRVECEF